MGCCRTGPTTAGERSTCVLVESDAKGCGDPKWAAAAADRQRLAEREHGPLCAEKEFRDTFLRLPLWRSFCRKRGFPRTREEVKRDNGAYCLWDNRANEPECAGIGKPPTGQ